MAWGTVNVQSKADMSEDKIQEILVSRTSDATAVAANIDSGKTAYVAGAKITGTSTKVDTSGATAAAKDIASGKTAYVKGSKVTGTAVIPTYTAEWGNTISATIYTTNPKKTNFYFFGTTLNWPSDKRVKAYMYGMISKSIINNASGTSTSNLSVTRNADNVSGIQVAAKNYSSDTLVNTGYCLIDY